MGMMAEIVHGTRMMQTNRAWGPSLRLRSGSGWQSELDDSTGGLRKPKTI